MTNRERARAVTQQIGQEVARLGQWRGLGSALARGNVEKLVEAHLDAVEREALDCPCSEKIEHLEAQCAALREALTEAMVHRSASTPSAIAQDWADTLADTAAAAEAHDERIRREAMERAEKAVENVVVSGRWRCSDCAAS